MAGLSVIIITRNEEDNLPDCLESVSWADEIVVVDSGSTDRTREMAEARRAKVVRQDFLGFGPQKAYALTLATQPWVLSLDADERVSGELGEEIREILRDNPETAGYSIRRQNYFLGNLIRHGGWQRDWVVRLFRRGQGNFSPAPIHEKVIITGKVGRLNHPLVHFPYLSLDEYFHTCDLYTGLSARWLAEQGKTARWPQMVFRPLGKFLRMYVIELGFLDGYPGLVLAVLSTFHLFARYARLWEKNELAKKIPEKE